MDRIQEVHRKASGPDRSPAGSAPPPPAPSQSQTAQRVSAPGAPPAAGSPPVDQVALQGAAGHCRDLPLPLHDQYDGSDRNACGTTSASMILDYLEGGRGGRHHSQMDREMRNHDLFSAPDRLLDYAQRNGFRAALKNGASPEDIKHLVDRGLPAQALIDPEGRGKGNTLHYVAIRGYQADPSGQVASVKINDPAGGQTYDMPWGEFESKWSDLTLKGHQVGLDRVLLSYAPQSGLIQGTDGVKRAASTIRLPGGSYPGLADGSRPALAAADGIANMANVTASGNTVRAAGGLVQTVGGGLAAPTSQMGQALQELGAAQQERARLGWGQGGVGNRLGAAADYTKAAVNQGVGAALETTSNLAASAAHNVGEGLGKVGDGLQETGRRAGEVIGRWIYGD